jgi:hypothetical protein
VHCPQGKVHLGLHNVHIKVERWLQPAQETCSLPHSKPWNIAWRDVYALNMHVLLFPFLSQLNRRFRIYWNVARFCPRTIACERGCFLGQKENIRGVEGDSGICWIWAADAITITIRVRNNQLLAGNGNTSNANKSKYARRRLVGAQIELTSDVAIACPLWQLRRLSISPIFSRSTQYIGLKKEKNL